MSHHYNSHGIDGAPSIDLLVGSTVHRCLETVLKQSEHPFDSTGFSQVLDSHTKTVTRMIPADDPEANAKLSSALCEALVSAWARITLPWVRDNFEILSVEVMHKMEIPYPNSAGSFTYRAKPDFVMRHKDSGVLSIHDFKTTGYWDDASAEQWKYNIQMYATAYLVQEKLKETVEHYYIHPLVKGNKRYPSPLVYPYHAPKVTPTGKDIFSLKWRKGFERKFVYNYMPVEEFIWEVCTPSQLTQFVPVAGPYEVDEEMALDFLSGVTTESLWWEERLLRVKNHWEDWADPDFQKLLISLFPRAYTCWDFKKLCPYHPLCFRQKGWQDPAKLGFKKREYV